jgi:hypothetical protein
MTARLWLAIVWGAAVMAVSMNVDASPISAIGKKLRGYCSVTVGKREYMKGPCTALAESYKTEDQFYVVIEDEHYYVSVTSDGKKWFGEIAKRTTPALYSKAKKLGAFDQSGACWVGQNARICFQEQP